MPVGARFSALVQTRPEAHLTSFTMSTGFLYRGKSGRVVALTNHSYLAKVKEKVELYVYSPSMSSCPPPWWILPVVEKYEVKNVKLNLHHSFIKL
jgi:hypothetical protein